MADDKPLVRQWLLLKLLSARHYGATVAELSKELNVHEKTVRRDLKTFQAAGIPLVETIGDFGRKTWQVDPKWKQPAMPFALDEVIALYIGQRFLEPLAGTLFWDAAQRAFKKLRASFSPGALKYLATIAGRVEQTSVGKSDYSQKAQIIDDLMQGIEDCRMTQISYRSLRATEPVTYDVYPYGLVYHRGSLYLVAHSPDHEELRHYKVDRIDEAAVSTFPFNRPADFELGKHLEHAFGVYGGNGAPITVKVRFAARVVRYVEESQWHASQQLAKQRDGSLLATFKLSDYEEIKRWIMSFGAYAEVLEPEKLRQEVIAELETLLRTYSPQEDAEPTVGELADRPRRRSPGSRPR